ncbi:MAG: hypothetical protein B7Z70_06090 [Acidithiobacillus ferrivorans]|uniref:TssC1 N-terminal domain-containing protein n=1 Tax=Acidithiobacillus ferrivorans TaxID=160808 RepID=A0A257T7B8_9PROT|nr:MAG: hypothetical protein B7Z70_06090 [Acidithiobacillus ferrivorans]
MIDAMLAAAIDEILHAPRLLRLEGSWRGLHWLADRIEASGRVRLRVLHAAWGEVCRDLERAAEFDQSQLFRRIYEDEFGTPGGEPYGLLVMDYEVRHRPGPDAPSDDVAAIAGLSAIAAAAFAPMIFGAAAALFGVDRMEELSGVANPAAIFTGPEHQRFRNLGQREDMLLAMLALGANHRQAMRSLYSSVVRSSLIPTIDSLKSVGMIHIPGITAGMILAGMAPLTAVSMQLVVMVMLTASVTLSVSTAVLLAAPHALVFSQRIEE